MRYRTWFARYDIRSLAPTLLVAGLFGLAACGGDSPTDPGTTTGTVEVSASTTGDGTDADGYSVTLNGGNAQSLGVNGSATFSSVDAGEATLELTGVAANCSVQGDNPRTVQVQGGQTTSVAFDVACSARTGDMEVSASTTGQDQDSDGYTVTVDPGASNETSQSVGPNGTVTFADLSEGDHEVALSGVANNCSVDGQNPRTVTVPFDGTATVTFDVSCTDAVGDLEVTASTTGDDQDSDGYTVTVDGTQSQSVASDGTITFTGLAAATHSVELTGVAQNCSVSGDNPRDVDVPNGGTATVTFDVSCSQQVGDLEVSASTTGQDQDTDGYTATVDPGTAGEVSQALGVNATVTFADLPDGDHQVELTGLQSNCSVVTDPNPRTVTVPAGGTASTTFEVECVERTGSIDVTTNTTGGDPDSDGYTVEVDASPVGSIGVNDTQTFSGIDEGTRTVSLSGVSSHCAVANDDQSVTVDFNATTSVSFDVSCPSPLSNQIVFESDRDDPGGNTSIYVMNPDGSGQQRLTDPSFNDSNPHVSPDGRRIVFVSGRGGSGPELWIMNPDGSGKHKLLDITFNGINPQWSPVVPPNADTTQIAFARGGADRDLWVVDADGTDRRQLTNTVDCEDLPSWSPDGARIAFTSTSGSCNDAGSDVWVTLADGSGTPTQVTTASGFDGNPTWAEQSDGTNFIAFSSGRDGDEEVYRVTVNADGTSPTNVTNLTQSSTSNEGFAAWKPDGTAIAFYSDRDGQAEVYTMNADGSAQTRLTTDPRTDWAPVWTP